MSKIAFRKLLAIQSILANPIWQWYYTRLQCLLSEFSGSLFGTAFFLSEVFLPRLRLAERDFFLRGHISRPSPEWLLWLLLWEDDLWETVLLFLFTEDEDDDEAAVCQWVSQISEPPLREGALWLQALDSRDEAPGQWGDLEDCSFLDLSSSMNDNCLAGTEEDLQAFLL